ncbi:DUF6188 family protein [Actinoplanes sp. NPDC051346]|uniref:DUF6188 family protein n=1 Tax=Actinoplanes sp. NPDC051346 TaxID=3155048 RepID=UPI003440034D
MVAENALRLPREAVSINLLVGQRLESVRLGHAIVLSFSGGRQVVIESLVHLSGPGGRAEVQPGENPSDVLATLLGEVVQVARAHHTGELHVAFGSGSRLSVDVDPDFESWAVTGPDGLHIVCLARGELAFWGDARTSARR